MEKLIVARLQDGRLFKGETSDFHPGHKNFSIRVTEGPWKDKTVTLELSSLKAIFFVRTLKGNREYREKKLQIPTAKVGQTVTVTFKDGETIRGTTMGANLGLSGFYLFPADPSSNNKRIFIVRDAVKDIKVLKK